METLVRLLLLVMAMLPAFMVATLPLWAPH
jgi:hypothetical protein